MKHEFVHNFISYVKVKLFSLFGFKGPKLEDDAPITMPIQKRKYKKVEESDEEEIGIFRTFEDLLDQLDDYFFYLGLLKKNDKDAYEYFKNVGGQITPQKTVGHTGSLAPIWKTKSKPSHGMIFTSEESQKNEDGEYLVPKFMYFQKVTKSIYCQPFNGDTYLFTMYYVNKKSKKSLRVPIYWYVGIDKYANLTPLKVIDTEDTKVRWKGNKTHRQHQKYFIIKKPVWSYGQNVEYVLKDRKKDMSKEGFLAAMFSLAANISTYANDGVRINVEKDDLVGVFNIPMERTSYFFKDREKTVNENGVTKRIFHVTKAHLRTYADGRQVPVRLHFKGLRKFFWNGYKITITVDGLHHKSLVDLNLGIHEVDPKGKYDKKEWIGAAKAGEIIKNAIIS